eukprot:3373928-Rhodomonas_salina.3
MPAPNLLHTPYARSTTLLHIPSRIVLQIPCTLLGAAYALSGTVLRIAYALPGTNVGYTAGRSTRERVWPP